MKRRCFSVWLFVGCLTVGAHAAPSLLSVSSSHHYFTNSSGSAVFLSGKHNWPMLVNNSYFGVSEGNVYNHYVNYINDLANLGQNLTLLWPSDSLTDSMGDPFQAPHPFGRSTVPGAYDGGNKFDLTTYNSTYFDKLAKIVAYANSMNVYVIVRLFDGYRTCSPTFGIDNYWPKSIYNSANNVNGTLDNFSDLWTLNSNGQVLANHLANYVQRTIDAVGSYPNVLWEVMCEGPVYSKTFQHYVVKVIKNYEAQNGRLVHPVGMSAFFPNSGGPGIPINANLFSSNWAKDEMPDFVSPVAYDPNDPASDAYAYNPPPLVGSALLSIPVMLLDTDHIGWNVVGGTSSSTVRLGSQLVWKAFTRGYSLLYMDGNENPVYALTLNTNMQKCMGDASIYAAQMNLLATGSSTSVASTTYCLTNSEELLVYQPSNAQFSVALQKTDYKFEWFNPVTHMVHSTGSFKHKGGSKSFRMPDGFTEGVLYLQQVAVNPPGKK